MRILKRFIIILLLTLGTLAVLVYVFLQTQKPKYNGAVSLDGFDSNVTVYFDDFAIPHIYASNAADAYRALGYVVAQDRIFQMELIRRVTAGRLSEIFGSQMLETDKFFRMLGLHKQAERLAREFYRDTTEEWKQAMIAYVEGVNQYIDKRSRRIEFKLLNIPSEHFSVKDIYLIVGYMAFNFEMGLRTDPVMTRIQKQYGTKYLEDLGLFRKPAAIDSTILDSIPEVSEYVDELLSSLPIPAWMGSNAIVIGPDLSASGKAMLENDTHVGLQQPAVWYEAYLNYPGFRFYGSFLSGFPFAPTGHTPHHAWGLTMLENDDFDMFMETTVAGDSNTIVFNDSIEKMQMRTEIIRVKDSADVSFVVRSTHHGPVCSDVIADLKKITPQPVSICWSFLQLPNNLPSVTWRLAKATSMSEFRTAVSDIGAPGLNILYADRDDNIAWYSACRYVHRPDSLESSVFLDGKGKQDWLGYYDFARNPFSENPVVGYVFSSNTAPAPDSLEKFPGYYLPQDRFVRLNYLLHQKKKYSRADLQTISLDVLNPVAAKVSASMMKHTPGFSALRSQTHERAFGILGLWSGSHAIDETGPVIYYKWLYLALKATFEDELGEKDFAALLKTHTIKSALPALMENENSSWWDDIRTKKRETRDDILGVTFDSTITQLIRQSGFDPSKWKWGNVHQIEFQHPLGQQKPLDKVFNIGPWSCPGGMETVNNQSFDLNETGIYKVNLAPALRRTIDFADPENAFNILPSGQSGNFTTRHYRDQAKMFVKGNFRKEIMNDNEVRSVCRSVLTIQPTK